MSVLSADTSNIKEIKQLSSFLKKLSHKYLLLIADDVKINCSELSLRRLLKAFGNKRAGIVYSDFMRREGNNLVENPLIDYQRGSIRDDFNFGYLLLFSCSAIKTILQKYGSLPADANVALYDLRLKISTDHELIHVPQFLYKISTKEQKKNIISGGAPPAGVGGSFSKRDIPRLAESIQPPAGAGSFLQRGKKTEAHFDYVVKENFIRQKKLEKIATNHLKRIGAFLPPVTKKTNKEQDDLQWKASMIIPVLNRKKTITDALTSALAQKTDFPFNIIVVDNYSTDGTTEILKKYAAKYPHVHHLIPVRRDLGIGGCWNEAVYSSYCGRYAIQLDSDDLYSSKHTLQKIVDTLLRGNYAMVVGSYTIVNERLKKIPPGLIAHKEWTQANGHNNALRINGLGAPRAFDSAVIRQIGFPNVSYGEDYAVALRIAREYKIGRIYENLYWCRRWTDNTDAGISREKQNRNDFYKDELRTIEIKERQVLNKKELKHRIFAEHSGGKQKSLVTLCLNLLEKQKKSWSTLAYAYRELDAVRTRSITCGGYKVYLQFNPQRAVSSGAAVDAESIKNRPCFLCKDNLPGEQQGILYRNRYLILCNPAPIFDKHFTIVNLRHRPQKIDGAVIWLMNLAQDLAPDFAVFYNGPACGASAPDHLHFQMVPVNALPFLNELKELTPVKEISSVRYSMGKSIDRSVIVMESKYANELTEQFFRLLKAVQKILLTNDEPLVNVICAYTRKCWQLVIFLRQKHRPDAYFAEGENRIFISPGAIDMAGVIITPRLDDYKRLDCNSIRDIYREVSLPDDLMNMIINKL